MKRDAAGSFLLSLLDARKGFNQVKNSRRARRALAVLANSGCYLPEVLTMGPTNGPEDFSFVVDLLFSLGRRARRRLIKEWLAYIDDFCVRTGRWCGGQAVSDEIYDRELQEAVRASGRAGRSRRAIASCVPSFPRGPPSRQGRPRGKRARTPGHRRPQ